MLQSWFQTRVDALAKIGIDSSISWGPADRRPASAWVDFESGARSARLIVWANGQADLMIGDLDSQTVLLEEHREISATIGLDDAEATIREWLVGATG